MHKRLILVVDNEPPIVRMIEAALAAGGFAVLTARSGEAALARLDAYRPDLVVLDAVLPGIDGFETLRRLRLVSPASVVMISARASDADRLLAFAEGADDVLARPFSPDELVARVTAILRRDGHEDVRRSRVLRYPGLTIDLDLRRVVVGGTEARLTRIEWELLTCLAANVGRVMLHGDLLGRVWGPDFREETHFLRTCVSRLRHKLEAGPPGSSPLTTLHGLGYRLDPPPEGLPPVAGDLPPRIEMEADDGAA